MTLYDWNGVELVAFTDELDAGEWLQENRPFATRAGLAARDPGCARVAVTSGAGVLVRASVVDNVTDDPTTVEALS